jgi:hypothetical protein
MLSLNYENINYVMTQILKFSCVSFSYVSISYVLAAQPHHHSPSSQCLVEGVLYVGSVPDG